MAFSVLGHRLFIFNVMNSNTIRKYISVKFAILLAFTALVFVITRLGVHHPHLVERWYSQLTYPKLAALLNRVTNVFPFSLDDLFYACLIGLFIYYLVLMVMRRLKPLRFIKRIISMLAVVYCLFNVLWGFNYYRSDLNQRLNLKVAEADVDELMAVFAELITDVNASYTPVYTIDQEEILCLVEESYTQHANFLKLDASTKVKPKPITLSRFFAAATIAGYYGPFGAEVHLNKNLLPFQVPAIMAHEMAHRYGITSEAEANFYAWYVCTHSNDKRLAYSANLHLLRYFVYTCHRYEGFAQLVKNIRYEVRHDFYKSRFHWMSLMDKNVELVATKVNDAYLKSNNVAAGIDDYEGVIKHVMDYKTSE